jgi:hypothetical protein
MGSLRGWLYLPLSIGPHLYVSTFDWLVFPLRFSGQWSPELLANFFFTEGEIRLEGLGLTEIGVLCRFGPPSGTLDHIVSYLQRVRAWND